MTPLPLLTHDLPGTGGMLRTEPADFDVTEIPAYEPCGQGDHLYLWIEKTGIGPEFLLKLLARKLGISDRDIGVAGLKDRHAITRQWVSVPAMAEERIAAIDGDGLRLLSTNRHTNKLRTGHLRGNRFRITIRGADRAAPVERILDRIRSQGLPNYYGEQRFGRDGDTHMTGLAMLRGERIGRVPPFKRKLVLSAVQSWLFNETLAARMHDGLLRTVLAGDVMMKWPAGGLFVAEDVLTEQARFDAREIVIGGPMFGTSMFAAAAVAAEREAAVLAWAGLTIEMFAGFGKLLSGTRRHSIVYLDDLTTEWCDDRLVLSFSLPSGSYATVLLREVMKPAEATAIDNDADSKPTSDADDQ
jgi:tRNA pseudouridine13 synthase